MLERNRLQAGTYVEPLPIGLLVTLQYSDEGKLDSAFIGHFESNWKPSGSVLNYVLTSGVAPAHIDTHNGTALVRGVLYCGKTYTSVGEATKVLANEIIEDLREGVKYNFFAGHITSTSMNFTNVNQERTWLQARQFKLLPGYIVPHAQSDKTIKKFIDDSEFEYKTLLGFFIFDQGNFYVEYNNLVIDEIFDQEVYLDQSGFVHCEIELSYSKIVKLSFYERQRLNLKNSNYLLLLDNEVISAYPIIDKFVPNYQYTCPVCGKVYEVTDEFMRCPDVHCLSRLYDDVNHFLKVLELPKLSYSDYLNSLNVQFTKFSDVFLLDPYRDIEIITTLIKILDGVIPVWAVRNRGTIWEFYTECNGSIDSITYYLNNPSKISSDLGILSNEFITWLSDEENVNTIFEILQYSNIVLTGDDVKFDGDPIFRGKKIFLTGKFRHGSYAEVSAILRSYSAEISDHVSADCCIIGDIPEDIEGMKVNTIRNRGARIFNESEFFAMYDIDSDL